jgi:membrane-bound lytic murein transglycosylase D
MVMFVRRYWLLIGIVMFAATGCLRSAADTDFQAPQSLDLQSPTPIPTDTPPPTPEEPPEEEAEVFPTAVAQQPDDNGIAEEDPFDIAEFDPPADEGIVEQEGPTPTLSDLALQATQIIVEATETAQAEIDLTQTAEGPEIPLDLETPTPDPFVEQPTATPAPIISGQDCIHEVRRGENLYRLSLRYGVLVNDIARASGVANVDRIREGQRLTIPGCGTTGQVPPPTSTPRADGTNGGVPSVGTRHTVQQGETLFQISLRYGVPVNTIAAANGISNINLIYINQDLVIP